MSRRRKLPPLPDGYVRTFLGIVCADHRQHAEAGIANVSGAALHGEYPSLRRVAYERGEVVDTWTSADACRTYTLVCRRCRKAQGRPRTVPLTQPRLITAVTAWSKSGIGDGRPDLDISLIPT